MKQMKSPHERRSVYQMYQRIESKAVAFNFAFPRSQQPGKIYFTRR